MTRRFEAKTFNPSSLSLTSDEEGLTRVQGFDQ